MFALLSASYMLGLLVAKPCISEMKYVPEKNETIVYKCVRSGHAIPPMLKDHTRVPAAYIPPEVDEPKVVTKPKKKKYAKRKYKKAARR